MLTEKFQSQPPTPKQIKEFILVLSHYGLYQPEELYKVICPFHADKNASLQISIPKCFFYCYAGCGAKGSTIELHQLFQQKKGRKINTFQALQEIKAICKEEERKGDIGGRIEEVYTLTNPSNSLDSVGSKKELLLQAKTYYNNLPTPCWYRASNKEEIEEETRQCKTYMLKRGYSSRSLQKSEAKPSLNSNYPIIFPLLENGIFRGYVMRTFDKEIEGQRKYMYNKGFNRKLSLPGTFTKEQPILLVEGYLDCLAAKQLGIKNVAAILGWKISSEQVQKLIKKKITKIICGTDNDEAGNKGYKYLKRIASSVGFQVQRIRYPQGIKDFGDLLNNPDQAQKILNQCKSFDLL